MHTSIRKVLFVAFAIVALSIGIQSTWASGSGTTRQLAAPQVQVKVLEKKAHKHQSVINWWNHGGKWALGLKHDSCSEFQGVKRRKVCNMARRSLAFNSKHAKLVERKLASLVPSNGEETARYYLKLAGATQEEIEFAIPICRRESGGCNLGAINQNSSTGDNSWGPWQINYYGYLYPSRARLLGEPSSNTSSWDRAAKNFLKFLRTNGTCHWKAPHYCAG